MPWGSSSAAAGSAAGTACTEARQVPEGEELYLEKLQVFNSGDDVVLQQEDLQLAASGPQVLDAFQSQPVQGQFPGLCEGPPLRGSRHGPPTEEVFTNSHHDLVFQAVNASEGCIGQ